MDSGEIVVYGADRNYSGVILNFLAEGVGQASKSPHAHPHRQVVPFDETEAPPRPTLP